MKNQISLSQAIAGYKLNIQARRLSQNTINDYTNTLTKFQGFMGESQLVTDITPIQINAFMAAQPVSNKTLSNYHATLSSMWRWLQMQGFVQENICSQVERPRPEKRVIAPLEVEEIRALLNAVDRSKSYTRPGKRESSHRIYHADRNRAILMFLLDNGSRVSELVNIKMKDMDQKNSRVFVFGKGAKERFLPFSPRTGQVIWKYLTLRGELEDDNYLFANRDGRQLTRRLVHNMVATTGKRAGIERVYPHRLRHTFAVSYLRAGGDIFTLQMILGHEDIDMVRHYSRLASVDIKRAHRRASPVEFLRL